METSKKHMKEMRRNDRRRKGDADFEVEVPGSVTHDRSRNTFNFLSMDRIVGHDPFEQQAVDDSALMDQFRAKNGEDNCDALLKVSHCTRVLHGITILLMRVSSSIVIISPIILAAGMAVVSDGFGFS